MAPFRFALQVSECSVGGAWRGLARRAEDLGYSTLYVPDHLDDQWAPLVALTVAAEATTSLRVGTLVLDNDFRHPVVLAKEAATLDLVSGGRFEFGLGAGWFAPLRRVGHPDGARPRCGSPSWPRAWGSRIRAMWRDGKSHLRRAGSTVTRRPRGPPHPLTPGGPPLVIGGGGKRILTLAGRCADIVSIVPQPGRRIRRSRSGGRVRGGEVRRPRERGPRAAAGDRADELEIQCWTVAVQVVPNAAEVLEALAALMVGLTPEQLRDRPHRSRRHHRGDRRRRCPAPPRGARLQLHRGARGRDGSSRTGDRPKTCRH